MLLAYQYYSSYMGAKSGLNYLLLMKQTFGKFTSQGICLVWCLLFMGWYSITPVLMTESVKGMFNWTFFTPLMAVPLAILMAVNNWFGFRGVANFARYIAAPILILWVAYAFGKALCATSPAVLMEPGHQSLAASLVLIPILIVGDSIWGNEADFFRFGKPRRLATLIPLVVAIVIGEILFPLSGWLMGRISGATDVATFTRFMNDYSFGHSPWIALLVLAVSNFAVNDGNLYGAVNAFENLWKGRRRNVVLILVVAASALTSILSFCADALDTIATLNSVILPCATMVIIFHFFVEGKLMARMRSAFLFIPENSGVPESVFNFSSPSFSGLATGALLTGWAVGIATSGIIPQLKALNVGVWILYAWTSSFAFYGIGKLIAAFRSSRSIRSLTILESMATIEPELAFSHESEAN
jgi:purine-cytosine permease-like protein